MQFHFQKVTTNRKVSIKPTRAFHKDWLYGWNQSWSMWPILFFVNQTPLIPYVSGLHDELVCMSVCVCVWDKPETSLLSLLWNIYLHTGMHSAHKSQSWMSSTGVDGSSCTAGRISPPSFPRTYREIYFCCGLIFSEWRVPCSDLISVLSVKTPRHAFLLPCPEDMKVQLLLNPELGEETYAP